MINVVYSLEFFIPGFKSILSMYLQVFLYILCGEIIKNNNSLIKKKRNDSLRSFLQEPNIKALTLVPTIVLLYCLENIIKTKSLPNPKNFSAKIEKTENNVIIV